MKLIKLTDDHYVVVDDYSEIKYKDWYIDDTNQVRMCVVLDTDYWKSRKEYKKITHSTQPLGIIHGENGKETIVYGSIGYISLQEVKELIGEVDLEKKAEEKYTKKDFAPGEILIRKITWINGYNQAIEDNKEKKYTEAQMRECWRASVRFDRPYNEGYAPNLEEFIQSLQPKTEWEVCFVDDKLKVK